MKATVQIHQPHASTHLPTHELTARRLRASASLPLVPKPSRPTPIPRGRKTVDTRFSNL